MFKSHATAESVTKTLDLSGHTIMITGVNSGLGFETMRVLAARGAHVIAAARTLDKARAAAGKVEGKVSPIACELSCFKSVSECAESIQSMNGDLDVLICNAGIMALPKLTVKHGLEMQFLCNHMGHFLLSYLLKDKLIEARGRLVMLSSLAHFYSVKGGINFDNLDGANGYDAWQFYGQSKLANLLTARAFHEHFGDAGLTALAVHPGVINTNLGRDLKGLAGLVLSLPFANKVLEFSGGKTIAEGAACQCYAATHPSVRGLGGRYFSDCKEAISSRPSQDPDLAQRLWNYSLDYLADYLDTRKPQPLKPSPQTVTFIGEDS